MKRFLSWTLQVLKLIVSSLTPLAVIAATLLIIASALIIYDEIQTVKDRWLGSKLAENIISESSCERIVSAGEKFNLEFNFTNKNDQPIALEKFWLEKSLLGADGRKFTKLLGSQPASFEGDKTKLAQSYNLPNVSLQPRSKLALSLNFQAAERDLAAANPHTIVVYKGKITFDFAHEIGIEVPCEVQVRYAD